MTLRRHLELWQQSGGYLSGIQGIALALPNLTVETLLRGMASQGYFGGWGEQAIRNAFAQIRLPQM